MSLLQEEKTQDILEEYENNENETSYENDRMYDMNNVEGSGMLSGSSSSVAEAGELQNTSPVKRRKIDKDGFVTPATPDIPKTSCYYGTSSRNRSSDPENEDDLKVSATQDIENESEDPVMLINEKEVASLPIEEIIKNMEQETKMLHLKWSSILSESENYELFCPSRLDKLIQQAKELENNLMKQKDLLHRRLKLISDTLRMI